MHYIITAKGLTAYDKGNPLMLLREDSRWDSAIDALRTENFDLLVDILTPIKAIQRFVSTNGRMVLEDGVISLDGQELDDNDYTIRKILSYAAEQLPLEPLMRFFMRLQTNPSFRVRRDLLNFLEVGELPISSDGRFLAYKKVREDFLDHHTGTVSYAVGTKPSMPRNAVDDDPNNTCSAGLHVCSYGYLGSFGDSSSRIVAVSVDPADVVSIPSDYNHTKMRVCSMEVMSEIAKPTQANVWGSQLVTDYDEEDEDEDEEEREEEFAEFGY